MRLRIAFLSFTLALAASAQQTRLVSDGGFTAAQAERGKAIYAERCANCHRADLSGGDEAPALTGEKFLAKWRSRPLADLSENIRTTMPADRPGSLSPAANADVVAFVLASNKFRAGALEAASTSAPAAPQADPAPLRIEGRPIQALPPEKKDNKPYFPQQTRAPYHATPPYKLTTLADNMPPPFSLAFLPSGRIIVTYKLPGSIRILETSGPKKGSISAPVSGVRELASPAAKDIGILEVALDPKFPSNHRIFFTFFDYIDGTDGNTNIARATFDEANLRITDAKVLLRTTPAIPSKRLGSKTGGRIAFGPDGSIFFSTGDRSDSPPWDVAQRLDSHLGKILHITPGGAPAPDNPFLGKPGVLPEIWAYGIRNAEGLAFDPRTGRLWENEHGPRGGDELNIIEKGRNYGWPIVVHGIDYPGNAIGEGVTHREGLEEPVYYWDPVIAPSGLAVYTGTLFPAWRGSIFVGGLRAKMLVRLTMVNDKVTAEEPLLTELDARIRDVKIGPDGAVYVLTDSGGAS